MNITKQQNSEYKYGFTMTTLTYKERLKNTQKLLLACSQCDVETVKQLLPLSCSTHNYDWTICEAIKNHQTEIVQQLLTVAEPHILMLSLSIAVEQDDIFELLLPKLDVLGHSGPLTTAALLGRTEMVSTLIPFASQEIATKALGEAVRKGHVEATKLLIPVSDPKANNSEVLRTAALLEHKQIVELLIPVSDPKALESAALFWAINKRNKDLIDLLIPVSDYHLLIQKRPTPLLLECVEEYETLQLKERLNKTLETHNINKTSQNHQKRKM